MVTRSLILSVERHVGVVFVHDVARLIAMPGNVIDSLGLAVCSA